MANSSGLHMCSFGDSACLAEPLKRAQGPVECSGYVIPLGCCTKMGSSALRMYYKELSKNPHDPAAASYILFEFQLIMARTGKFYEDIDGLFVCEVHRRKLGWGWERSYSDCLHPEHKTWTPKEWNNTAEGRRRQHGHIVTSLALSQQLLRDYGVLLPVGTGICETCSSREKDLFRPPVTEVGDAFKIEFQDMLKNGTTGEPFPMMLSLSDPSKVGQHHIELSEGMTHEIVTDAHEIVTDDTLEIKTEADEMEAENVTIKEELTEEPQILSCIQNFENAPDELYMPEIGGELLIQNEIVENPDGSSIKCEPVTIDLGEEGLEVKASLCEIVFHVCPTCLQGFESEEELEVHKRDLHPGEVSAAPEIPEHKCDVCSETFDEYVDLCSHHFLKHHIDGQNIGGVKVQVVRNDAKKRILNADAGGKSAACKKPYDADSDEANYMRGIFDFQIPVVQLSLDFGEMEHICRICHEEFSEYEPFRVHLKQHRQNLRFSCPIKDCADFDTAKEMFQHMTTHVTNGTPGKPMWCSHCLDVFPKNFIKFRSPMSEVNKSNVYAVCVFCIAACTCTVEPQQDPVMFKVFKCKFRCDKRFSVQSELAKHAFTHHDECFVCESQIRHVITRDNQYRNFEHHFGMIHKCPKCGLIFKKQQEKMHHVLQHSKLKPPVKGRKSKRKCSHCAAIFKSPEKCEEHVEYYCPVIRKRTQTVYSCLEKDEPKVVAQAVPRSVTLQNKQGIIPPKFIRNIACLFCMETTRSVLDVDVHRTMCKPMLRCLGCEKTIKESEGVEYHKRNCKKCRTMQCVICRKYTGKPQTAFTHAKQCKERGSYDIVHCTKCRARMVDFESAANHQCATVKIDEDEEKPIIKCRYCSITLLNKSGSHESSCAYNYDRWRKRFSCDYCNIRYHTREERDLHLLTCMRGKCDFCHENFANEGHRIMHMRGCKYKPKEAVNPGPTEGLFVK